MTWKNVFVAGLLLRPLLIVPMAPSGPLGGSSLLPIGLVSVFAFSAMLAVGVFVAMRPAIAFGIFTGFAGVLLAAIGVYAGLPMPWPPALGAYNVALAAVGIGAWQELRPAPGG